VSTFAESEAKKLIKINEKPIEISTQNKVISPEIPQVQRQKAIGFSSVEVTEPKNRQNTSSVEPLQLTNEKLKIEEVVQPLTDLSRSEFQSEPRFNLVTIEPLIIPVTPKPNFEQNTPQSKRNQITVKPLFDAIPQQPNFGQNSPQSKRNQITIKPLIDPIPQQPNFEQDTPEFKRGPIKTEQQFGPNTVNSKTNLSSNLLSHQPKVPYKSGDDNKCSDTCCDDNRPQILMSRASPYSCCKGVSKIVIPIDMETLGRISTNEIIQVVNETNNVEMLKKLLKLAEKYNF
jgi:hypothetical protein